MPGCNKIYGKTSHLRAHLLWHDDKRPFVCNWISCGKKFTRSDELQRHSPYIEQSFTKQPQFVGFSLANLGSLSSKQNDFKISISLRQCTPLKKPGPSADFEKYEGGCYLKEILISNSFSFEDKDPRFTRLKPGLALSLLSKGLFYIRAMFKGMEELTLERKGLHVVNATKNS